MKFRSKHGQPNAKLNIVQFNVQYVDDATFLQSDANYIHQDLPRQPIKGLTTGIANE